MNKKLLVGILAGGAVVCAGYLYRDRIKDLLDLDRLVDEVSDGLALRQATAHWKAQGESLLQDAEPEFRPDVV